MMHTAIRWGALSLRSVASAVLTMLCALAALSFPSGGSPAAAPIAVAVADFDYFDTSGEVTDQSAEHRARVASFAKLLRDHLAAQGDYRVVPIECPDHPATCWWRCRDRLYIWLAGGSVKK